MIMVTWGIQRMSTIQQLNRELADKLNHEAKKNPQSPYAGKMIGIANGRLVVVADNWREVARKLEEVEPDSAKTFCTQIGRDYNEVQEIWRLA
jgi:hypothetical protein